MQTSRRVLGLAAAVIVPACIGTPARAQFEKVTPPQRIPPTGIVYTLPAAARAAGGTLASPAARLGLAGRNPAFLGGGPRLELALDGIGTWDDLAAASTLDRYDLRVAGLAGKLRLGRVSMGAAYQHPYRRQETLGRFIFRDGRRQEWQLRVGWAGAAVDVVPALRLGVAVAWQRTELVSDLDVWHTLIGTEVEVGRATLAAAYGSRAFGGDAGIISGPDWLHLDVRLPLHDRLTLGARFDVGWPEDDTNEELRRPVDAGAGVRVQILPLLHVLAGLHHVRERLEPPVGADPQRVRELFIGQGTFLDAGLELRIDRLTLSLAVEDSHAADAEVPSTLVTLSANAGF